MATATLTAAPRTETGKGAARKLRAKKQVPAVIYGHQREAMSLVVDAKELERLLGRYAAETTVVELSVDGTTARTLIRDIQRDPVKRTVIHVDFQELVAGEKITVDIPIVLVGTAAGVRNGGVMNQVMTEVSVEVDPVNIPNHLDLDVSALELNESLHVRDLTVPEGVEIQDDEDATVCVVSPPRVVEETPPAGVPVIEGAEGAAEPELIRKPKDEGEAEE